MFSFGLAIFLSLTVAGSWANTVRFDRVAELRVGRAPHYVALSPDGERLYVTLFAANDIQVIHLSSNSLGNRFYGGFEPLGIAVSPLGDKIFVTNLNPGQVKVIDAQTYRVRNDIKVGGMPSNITISPKGYEAYVTNYGRGRVGRVDFIDVSTERILGEVEVGIRPLVAIVSKFGDYLFVVCGGSNDVWVIDVAEREVIKQIPVGQAPDGIALSPDGNTLYVANSGSNDVSVIDVLDLEEIRRVPVGQKPFSIAVREDGTIFVVETGDNSVGVFDPEFRRLGNLKTGRQPIDIRLSPSGDLAFVTAERENRVYVFRVR